MSSDSRIVAGILPILLPTVAYEGTSILSLLVNDPGYAENQLYQDLWRAGHTHTGVLLVPSLVTLRYVDEAALSGGMRRLVRHSIPASTALLPTAFFLYILSPDTTEPNALVYLAYAGAVSLAVGLLVLEASLIRDARALSTLQRRRIEETRSEGIDNSRHHCFFELVLTCLFAGKQVFKGGFRA